MDILRVLYNSLDDGRGILDFSLENDGLVILTEDGKKYLVNAQELEYQAEELEAEENTENLFCMNRRQFYYYIIENFDISEEAKRLINNILRYVESQGMEENEQYLTLCELLDVSDAELKKVCL